MLYHSVSLFLVSLGNANEGLVFKGVSHVNVNVAMGKYVRHVGVTTAGVTSSMLTLLTCPRPHGRLLVTKLLRSGDPFFPAATALVCALN